MIKPTNSRNIWSQNQTKLVYNKFKIKLNIKPIITKSKLYLLKI